MPQCSDEKDVEHHDAQPSIFASRRSTGSHSLCSLHALHVTHFGSSQWPSHHAKHPSWLPTGQLQSAQDSCLKHEEAKSQRHQLAHLFACDSRSRHSQANGSCARRSAPSGMAARRERARAQAGEMSKHTSPSLQVKKQNLLSHTACTTASAPAVRDACSHPCSRAMHGRLPRCLVRLHLACTHLRVGLP